MQHELLYPFKQVFYKLWFWPAKYIQNYNRKDCENFYPDYIYGKGTKVKPILGYVLRVPEGDVIRFNWWSYLEKYEQMPNLPKS